MMRQDSSAVNNKGMVENLLFGIEWDGGGLGDEKGTIDYRCTE